MSGELKPAVAEADRELTPWQRITSFEALYRAHLRARLGKRDRQDVIEYEMNLSYNLERLRRQLLAHRYHLPAYRKFFVYEPKKREIQALYYRDRILQHALCDEYLTDLLDRRMIWDNAACRKGKGSLFARQRLAGFLRDHYRKYGRDGWVLKADIAGYFTNIDRDVLKQKLFRAVKDPDVQQLLNVILDEYDQPCGLPIGNQTSQLFAIYYLDSMDRLIKERLRVKYYTRYMDDFILVHPDREFLKDCLRRIREYLESELHLHLNEKTEMFPLKNGIDYIGFRFILTPTGRVVQRLRQKNKKRMRRKISGLKRAYAKGIGEADSIRRSLASMRGHLAHAQAEGLTRLLNEDEVGKARTLLRVRGLLRQRGRRIVRETAWGQARGKGSFGTAKANTITRSPCWSSSPL